MDIHGTVVVVCQIKRATSWITSWDLIAPLESFFADSLATNNQECNNQITVARLTYNRGWMEGVCFWSCCKNQSTCLLSCHRRRDSGNFNMFEFCCLNANQRQPTSHAYAMACMLEWDWGSREGLSLNWNPENKTTPHLPRLRPTYDFAAYRCQFHSWPCRLRPQSIVSALSWSCPASRPSLSLLSLSCPRM